MGEIVTKSAGQASQSVSVRSALSVLCNAGWAGDVTEEIFAEDAVQEALDVEDIKHAADNAEAAAVRSGGASY